MLNILSNRTYRHLFMAQVIALIGTGLATVALGLLAYDLAGDRAGCDQFCTFICRQRADARRRRTHQGALHHRWNTLSLQG